MPTRMKRRILDCLRGMGTAIVAMAVFAVPIGCLIALTLLVISMEEGGGTLTDLAMPLTEAAVLLTQGTGFKLGAVTLTLMPLLLTGLLVGLIAQVTRRFGASLPGFLVGIIVWVAANLAFADATTLAVLDQNAVIGARSALVFALGYAAGGLPGSHATRVAIEWLRAHVSPPVRRAIALGLATGGLVIATVLAMGLVATVVWIVLGHEDMTLMFDSEGMETGSRLLMSLITLFWLPNVAIWAVSWCAGAGFSIGDLATFTLWSGQGDGLPALPAFALLPAPVEADWARIAIQLVVPVTAAVIGLLVLALPKGFRLRPPRKADRDEGRRAVLAMAYPAGAFCLAAAVVAVGMSAIFALSNGGLGTGHLAHVGVVVMRATQSVGRTAAIGLTCAWLAGAVAVAAAWGLHWLLQSHHKEETDDKHEPSDQAGSGISLP